MPRGVPKAGYRKTKNFVKRLSGSMPADVVIFNRADHHPIIQIHKHESDDEIDLKLKDRFEILEELTNAALAGEARSVIVSGPSGLGKSYTVEQALERWDPEEKRHTVIKGYVRATGLYKMLYRYRHAGNALVFDDADTIFFDDTSLNFLKAVCDTNEKRRVSYLAEGDLVDEETGSTIPKSFSFNGTIIFITNYDFDAMIDKGHKLAPHLQAMMSRSHYVDLAMKTRQDYIIRIKQVVKLGLLKDRGLTDQQQKEVMDFIIENRDSLRELSLRVALKAASLRKTSKGDWKRTAQITLCRG